MHQDTVIKMEELNPLHSLRNGEEQVKGALDKGAKRSYRHGRLCTVDGGVAF